MKNHVKVVAPLLRNQEHMAVKGKVGDTMKTASLFFLCAAFIKHGAKSAKDLCRQIALFRFNGYGLSYDLSSQDRFARTQAGVPVTRCRHVAEKWLVNLELGQACKRT